MSIDPKDLYNWRQAEFTVEADEQSDRSYLNNIAIEQAIAYVQFKAAQINLRKLDETAGERVIENVVIITKYDDGTGAIAYCCDDLEKVIETMDAGYTAVDDLLASLEDEKGESNNDIADLDPFTDEAVKDIAKDIRKQMRAKGGCIGIEADIYRTNGEVDLVCYWSDEEDEDDDED